MQRRPWIATTSVVATLAALVAWSAWQRWLVLAASPFPLGVDGYFYPLQLRSLLAGHGLAYPDFPLTFWLMAPFAALTDPVVGTKLAAAIYSALIAVPMYGVGRALGGSRAAGLVAAVVAVTSAGSMSLTFEFVKNGIALTIAVGALWLVLHAAAAPTRARIALALVGVAAALLAHKMAAGIVLGIGVPAALDAAVVRGALRGRRLVCALLALTAGAGLVIALVPSLRVLGAGLWTTDAAWDAPALAFGRVRLMMGHEPLIGGVLALLAAIGLARPVQRWLARRLAVRTAPAQTSPASHPPAPGLAAPASLPPAPGPAAPASLAASPMAPGVRGAAWMVLALAVVIGLPWLATTDAQGLGFRMRAAAFVSLALCAALAVRAVAGPLTLAIAALANAAWVARLRAGLVIAAALAVFLATPRDRTEGQIVAHPAMVAAIMALDGEVPAGDVMIIPERHLMFMAAWYTGQPTRLRPEPVPAARRWRVMPLAFIRAGSPLDDALMAARRTPGVSPPLGLHPRHPNGLVLVREATWAWVLAQLPTADRRRLVRWPTI